MSLPASRSANRHGQNPHPLRERCQQDRRWRSRGETRLGSQRASGELTRRRRHANQNSRGSRWKEADSDHRRRLRNGARRCTAGLRASRHIEDQECRGPSEHRHFGIPWGGAALDRLGSASAPRDPVSARSLWDHRRDQWRQDFQSRRGWPSGRNVNHYPRPVLQHSGAKEIPQSRIDRAIAYRLAGHALRDGTSGKAFRIAFCDQCHACRASGFGLQPARLPGLWQRSSRPDDSGGGGAAAGTNWTSATSTMEKEGRRRG